MTTTTAAATTTTTVTKSSTNDKRNNNTSQNGKDDDYNNMTNIIQLWKHGLITKEDRPMHLHKTLGIFCLIHFIWRFVQYGSSDMGYVTYPFWTIPSILLHFFLSISSLIFHIPKKRIKGGYRQWPEYRLHSIVFALRSLLCMVLNYYEEINPSNRNQSQPPQQPMYIMNLIIVVLTLFLADISSWSVGEQYKSNTIRDVDVPNYVKFYYSMMQFYATAYCLFGIRRYSAHLIMVGVVQGNAFMMTLRRKNLASHHGLLAMYAFWLLFGSMIGWYEMNRVGYIPARITSTIACITYMLRILVPKPFNNKYILWCLMGLWLHYIRTIQPNLYYNQWEQNPYTIKWIARIIFACTMSYGLLKSYLLSSSESPSTKKES